ncbi:anhydro-N-acetylmuramic acid kinase [Carnimonas bestiolae]|uniref:anhydro-N-acetylmuramic acid kinase n=1 Tax=Carnimonas bestiolae TaxID=3402172 RepID=UPI003EDC3769
MKIIGMMSGTSFDAIDAAAVEITLDHDVITLQLLGMVSSHYSEQTITSLNRALPPGTLDMATQCRLDTEIGQAFAKLAVRADRELCDGQAALVAAHGQTVFHWVEQGQVRGTLQIGQPAWIAEQTGKPVVADFRVRDVAAGGQGAPLVSALDVMWLRGRANRSAALNLGGIANVTVVTEGQPPVAFDTGPANALIDAAMLHFSEGVASFDRNGEWAAQGEVDQQWLAQLLQEPYFAEAPPKTTGKELFNALYLHRALAQRPNIDPRDAIATLTALTAHSIAEALKPFAIEELVTAGGGTHNQVLMKMLADALPGVTITPSDALGLPAQAKEACAFALLGFLSWHGLPGTVPSCTGASAARVLGAFTPGAEPLRLPAPYQPQGRLALKVI